MEITELISHPERMDRDTLYELRSMLALHPYFQTLRLLMLQNLYLLHDSTFDEELRRAAIYINDRKVIFRMIEATHYQLRPPSGNAMSTTPSSDLQGTSRTVTLIETFLDSIPQDNEEKKKKRRPTPTDAAVDYVAYLLESEAYENDEEEPPLMKGQNLIDTFLEQERGRIMLSDMPSEVTPPESATEEEGKNSEKRTDEDPDEEYFTETLARIYIKQGRYQKALGIIRRLSLKYPQKNAYFGDQIRFLEKLIINSNNNKKK